MTDEEIEKAIELCESENLPCQECAYWKISLQGNNCRNVLIRDMHDYINRIKAENAKLKAVDNRVAFCNAYDHLQADYKRLIKEKQLVRKDTAKEILQEINGRYWNDIDTNGDIAGENITTQLKVYVKL